MKCERQERPQMVLDKNRIPLALISAVTGCPRALGEGESIVLGIESLTLTRVEMTHLL